MSGVRREVGEGEEPHHPVAVENVSHQSCWRLSGEVGVLLLFLFLLLVGGGRGRGSGSDRGEWVVFCQLDQ